MKRCSPRASSLEPPANTGVFSSLLVPLLTLVLLLSVRSRGASGAATGPADAPAGDRSTATTLNDDGIAAAKEGRFDAGVDALRRALQLSPNDAVIRKNLSGMLTDWALQCQRAGQLEKAEELLREAAERSPDNGRALAMLGDLAYFTRSDFRAALTYWKNAHSRLPEDERRLIADRMSQAQRDQTIEQGYASERTTHFEIRRQRAQPLALPTFGPVLEAAYAKLTGELGSGPPTITVILYPEQDIHRTYNQRDWAMGFYDGRLRLSGNEVEGDAAPILIAHELAHAFLHDVYAGSLPIWVHEGFAQWEEGPHPRSEEEARFEEGVVSGSLWIPLKWLDRRFTHPSGREDVGRAYVQARLVVTTLIAQHGLERFKAFLKQLSAGGGIESAYESAFAPARWSRTDQSILSGQK